jgi:hypothetical protein
VTSGNLGYGIDFGTSNSAVSIAYADRVEITRSGRRAQPHAAVVRLSASFRAAGRVRGVKTFLTSGHGRPMLALPLAPYGWDTDCRRYARAAATARGCCRA